MKISFFEEFPNPDNLNKIELVSWPATIYVAAKSLKEFRKIEKGIEKTAKKKNIMLGYWPVLRKEEGYWLSPFSPPKAIKRIISEILPQKNLRNRPLKICRHPLKIMWDAELPLRHPKLLFRWDNYLRNMPRIRRFFRKKGKDIITSEYLINNRITEFFFRILGVYFSPKKYGNKKIIMYYTSMHPSVKHLFCNSIREMHDTFGSNLQVGLGVTAHGILGDEPIISPKSLDRDLKEMKKIGVQEVVIFRLGGLNHKYLKIIKKYVS